MATLEADLPISPKLNRDRSLSDQNVRKSERKGREEKENQGGKHEGRVTVVDFKLILDEEHELFSWRNLPSAFHIGCSSVPMKDGHGRSDGYGLVVQHDGLRVLLVLEMDTGSLLDHLDGRWQRFSIVLQSTKKKHENVCLLNGTRNTYIYVWHRQINLDYSMMKKS